MLRSSPRALAGLLLTCLLLAACHREAVAPGDPVAAVRGLAEALRDNDLVRYSRLSMPPALYARLETRWRQERALAKPPTDAERRDYAHWIGRLTAPGAEANLYRSADPKLKKMEGEIRGQWPMMQATASIFFKGAIQASDKLSPAEKAHASELVATVLAWAQPTLITDRDRARQAIAVTVATAREIDLPTLDQAKALDMVPALEKAGVGFKGLKRLGLIYGIDGDAALDGVDITLTDVDGDLATMQVGYPLLGKTVKFEMTLIRRDGRWYSADAVRSAETRLAQPLVAAVP